MGRIGFLLVDLGLLSRAQIKRQDPDHPAFKKYFMHGVGHPLGLDVHDVGITTEPMRAGWVMTVEPAIYVREEGFAVRLENDVLITDQGPVDLMAGVPIEPEEIEERMKGRARFTASGNGGSGKANHAPRRRHRVKFKNQGLPAKQLV
jgi:Xaa-Pro aminopeptidase